MAASARWGTRGSARESERGRARGAGGDALILHTRGVALSTQGEGGLARARRAREVLDTEPGGEQCGVGDEARGGLGTVAT
jgi:hypothetical protein